MTGSSPTPAAAASSWSSAAEGAEVADDLARVDQVTDALLALAPRSPRWLVAVLALDPLVDFVGPGLPPFGRRWKRVDLGRARRDEPRPRNDAIELVE